MEKVLNSGRFQEKKKYQFEIVDKFEKLDKADGSGHFESFDTLDD